MRVFVRVRGRDRGMRVCVHGVLLAEFFERDRGE